MAKPAVGGHSYTSTRVFVDRRSFERLITCGQSVMMPPLAFRNAAVFFAMSR
jgi:hypothetical protein